MSLATVGPTITLNNGVVMPQLALGELLSFPFFRFPFFVFLVLHKTVLNLNYTDAYAGGGGGGHLVGRSTCGRFSCLGFSPASADPACRHHSLGMPASGTKRGFLTHVDVLTSLFKSTRCLAIR